MPQTADPPAADYETERRAAEARRRERLLRGRAHSLLEEVGAGASEEELRSRADETYGHRPEEERAETVRLAQILQEDARASSITITRSTSTPTQEHPMPLTPALPTYDQDKHSKALTALIREMLSRNPDATQSAILVQVPGKIGISTAGLEKRISDRLSYERSKSKKQATSAALPPNNGGDPSAAAPVATTGAAPGRAGSTAAEADGEPEAVPGASPAPGEPVTNAAAEGARKRQRARRAAKRPAGEAAAAHAPHRVETTARRTTLQAASDAGEVYMVRNPSGLWSVSATLFDLDFAAADELFAKLRGSVLLEVR
jgi:hypothetical protein